MSHQIRTPMTGVHGLTERLLTTTHGARQRRADGVAHRTGLSLLGVINDILDSSKIEAGRIELRAEPFELRDLVEEVMDTLAEVARRKGLEFNSILPADLPRRVIGSPGHLRQVLINLT